ncbi:MAG: hypothetical protein AAFP09_11440, partial [Cyanobacteria bacterium J06607_10]
MDPQADKLKELSEQLRKKEEELQALSKEVQKLDFEYRSDKKMVKSGVAVFVTLLVAFFGITLTQIPAQVQSQVEAKIGEETLREIQKIKDDAQTISDDTADIEDYRQQLTELVAAYQQEIDEVGSMGLNLFTAEKYKPLWSKDIRGGGPHEVSFVESDGVPSGAKGVLLKVMVTAGDDNASSSVVCADSGGNFSDDQWHYRQLGFTNYNPYFAGGVIFCPLSEERTIRWKNLSNSDKV